MIKIDGNTLTAIENVLIYKNGVCMADMDEVKSFTLSNSESSSDVTGAGDVVLVRNKKNKSVEIKGVSGLLSGGLMEMQTGGTEVYSATTIVNVSDTIKTAPTTLTDGVVTDYKAVGTANNEIGYIYVTNPTTNVTTRFTQAATASTDKFAYDTTTKKITLPTAGVVSGDTIRCYYNIETDGTKITNSSKNFSIEGRLVVNCMAKDGCGVESMAQLIIERADFDGNFDIEAGGDQTQHNFSAKALPNKCSTTNSLWDFIFYKLPTVA